MLARGHLAAILATAIAAAPALAQQQVSTPSGVTAARSSNSANDASSAPKWVREPIGGPKSDKFLRIADTRGMGEAVPAILALDASDRSVVILLVQGRNQAVIDDAKLKTSLLVLDGYDRLGLVLGDGPEDVAYIYSRGHKVMTLSNIVDAEDRSLAFDRNMKRIYERDVLPALGDTASPGTAVSRSGSGPAVSLTLHP